jgi:hypothetical protein
VAGDDLVPAVRTGHDHERFEHAQGGDAGDEVFDVPDPAARVRGGGVQLVDRDDFEHVQSSRPPCWASRRRHWSGQVPGPWVMTTKVVPSRRISIVVPSDPATKAVCPATAIERAWATASGRFVRPGPRGEPRRQT